MRHIYRIALVEIDCPRGFCVKAAIEKMVWVRQRRTFEKVNFDVVLECPKRTYVALGTPHGRIPFEFFGQF